MKLCVRTLEGSELVDEVKEDYTVEQFKDFLQSTGKIDLDNSRQHLVFGGKQLTDEQATLSDLGISDGGTLIVLEKRSLPEPEPEDPTPVPTRESLRSQVSGSDDMLHHRRIARASASAAPHAPHHPSPHSSPLDFDNALQHLIQAVAGLNAASTRLGTAPPPPPPAAAAAGGGDAVGEAEATVISSSSSSSAQVASETPPGDGELPAPPPAASASGASTSSSSSSSSEVLAQQAVLAAVDPTALAQLLEMGFPENRARKGLALHHSHAPAAMEWLLAVEDQLADAPLTEEQMHELQGTTAHLSHLLPPHHHPSAQQVSEREQGNGGTVGEPIPPVAPAPAAVRTWQDLVQQLVEMGFSEENAAEALRATGGSSLEVACSWLLGDREVAVPAPPPPASLSSLLLHNHTLRALATATSPPGGSHRLRTTEQILSHPAIRQGLQSEYVSRAFRDMILNPHTASDYLSDPQVGPILLQMHDLLVNQQQTSDNAENAFEDS